MLAPGVPDGVRGPWPAEPIRYPLADVQCLDRLRCLDADEAEPAKYRLPARKLLSGGFEPVSRHESADDQALARRRDHFGELGLWQVAFQA